jgi:23S rRNA pseudouridine2604 synthase
LSDHTSEESKAGDVELIRLNKLMAHRGLCSRREADALIAAGSVKVDGVAVVMGGKYPAQVKIEIDGQGEASLGSKWTIILNKPRGFVSQLPEEDQRAAHELITLDRFEGELKDMGTICQEAAKAAVAGRLDRSSRGLLILTTDGRVVSSVTQGGTFAKKYLVECIHEVTDDHIRGLNKMRSLNEWKLKPMEVTSLGPKRLKFVLREGKKHQIREVCHAVGQDVRDLYRVAVGPMELGSLAEGRWRKLTTEEVELLTEPSKRI